MKKSLRVFVLILTVSVFTLPSALAGPGTGNPSPIRGNAYSAAVSVILSLLGI